MTKLWFVRRTGLVGYDEYDSFVCAADTKEIAICIHPDGSRIYDESRKGWLWKDDLEGRVFNEGTWANPERLVVEYLGETDREIAGTVICASFNAG